MGAPLYYESCWGWKNNEHTTREWCNEYAIGLEWVIRYYTQGCSSWSWFYPAHYAPLCCDLWAHIAEPMMHPPLNEPFPAEMQLLAVLPPQSAVILPGEL